MRVLTTTPRPPVLVEQEVSTAGGAHLRVLPSIVKQAAYVQLNARVTPECCEEFAETLMNIARVLRGEPQE